MIIQHHKYQFNLTVLPVNNIAYYVIYVPFIHIFKQMLCMLYMLNSVEAVLIDTKNK